MNDSNAVNKMLIFLLLLLHLAFFSPILFLWINHFQFIHIEFQFANSGKLLTFITCNAKRKMTMERWMCVCVCAERAQWQY